MIYNHNHSYEWNCGAESRDDEVNNLKKQLIYLKAMFESTNDYLKDLEADYDEIASRENYGGS